MNRHKTDRLSEKGRGETTSAPVPDESPYFQTIAAHRMENVEYERDIGRHGDYCAGEIKIYVPRGRTGEARRVAAYYEGIKGEV